MALDNVDQSLSTDLHGITYDYLKRLASSLKSNHVTMGGPNKNQSFKLAIAVRDWNVRTFAGHAEFGSIKEKKITLSTEGQGFIDQHDKPTHVELDHRLMNEIILTRLSICKDSLDPSLIPLHSDFQMILKELWIREKIKIGLLPLSDVSNYSIRYSLVMVVEIAFSLMQDLYSSNRAVTNYLKLDYRISLRGRIINWLFNSEDREHYLRSFIQAELSRVLDTNKKQSLCGTHRLILTYLTNIMKRREYPQNGRTTVGNLAKHLEEWTGTTETSVRSALLFLFKSGQYQSDYLTIYQTTPILNMEDIALDSIVHINPRGMIFLQSVMQRIEYWSHIADITLGESTLFDLYPDEVVEKATKIVANVKLLSKAHFENWKKISERFMTGFGPTDKPFQIFNRQKLIFRDNFYLARVSKSHQEALRKYILLLMRGVEGILVKNEDVEDFSKKWPTADQTLYPNEISLEDRIIRYKENEKITGIQRQTLSKLLKLSNECQSLSQFWGKAKGLTFEELKGVTS